MTNKQIARVLTLLALVALVLLLGQVMAGCSAATTGKLTFHPWQHLYGDIWQAGYFTDRNGRWMCDVDSQGQKIGPCDGTHPSTLPTLEQAEETYNSPQSGPAPAPTPEPIRHIYHPWLKKNGKYSGAYYADQHGRWLCRANDNGEPLHCPFNSYDCYVTSMALCDGSDSHDHTQTSTRLPDGSEIGGGIDPGDPVR